MALINIRQLVSIGSLRPLVIRQLGRGLTFAVEPHHRHPVRIGEMRLLLGDLPFLARIERPVEVSFELTHPLFGHTYFRFQLLKLLLLGDPIGNHIKEGRNGHGGDHHIHGDLHGRLDREHAIADLLLLLAALGRRLRTTYRLDGGPLAGGRGRSSGIRQLA
jgi:hypothetical protein